MNATKTTEQTIREELAKLQWMIPDAQRALTATANEMARRAAEAVKQCEAMAAGEPCTLGWVEFAECDVRRAREAKARLDELYSRQTLLNYLLGDDD